MCFLSSSEHYSYASIYKFRQSVDDGATVPLFYENRIPELQLTNENLNEEMEALLDEAQERRLGREFAREYHLITRDERLERVAQDVVSHFLGRGQMGRGMFIAIDKRLQNYPITKDTPDETCPVLSLRRHNRFYLLAAPH